MTGDIYQQLSQLNEQFIALYQAAQYREAIEVATDMCELAEIFLGDQSSDYADCLNQLATAYQAYGDYQAAKPLYLKVQSIDKPGTEDYAINLHNWAGLCESTGEYRTAEDYYLQALALKLELLGENDPSVARTQNDLGHLYYMIGEYRAAETHYKIAGEIWGQDPKEYRKDIATVNNNLAMLYEDMDRFAQADYHFKQARDIDRLVLREDDPDYAVDLNNSAHFYARLGDYAKAEQYFKQALEIMRARYRENHRDIALCLNNLGWLYQIQGNYSAAKPMFRQAMQIRLDLLGEDHSLYAESANNLAALDYSIGNLSEAEAGYLKAWEIYRQAFGENHPNTITALSNLSIIYASQDRQADALALCQAVVAAHDQLIDQIFAIGSESQRMAYIQSVQRGSAIFISLVAMPGTTSRENISACFDVVLRRKALTAEVLAAQRDALLESRHPHLKDKIKQVRTLRAQIGQKQLAGPGKEGLLAHEQQLRTWIAQREGLEAQLAGNIPEISLQIQLRDVDRGAVAQALLTDAALVEFVRTDVYDFQQRAGPAEARWKPPIYLAFILHAGQPDEVHMVSLGQAAPIDRLIADFRISVTGGGRDVLPEDTPAGQIRRIHLLSKLNAAVFEPLLPALGECRRLLIAPDGDLTMLPFEALPLDEESYVLDQYHISYLSTGRDVLRYENQSPRSFGETVVVADPNYDLGASDLTDPQSESHPSGWPLEDLRRADFPLKRLPGTREEGVQLARLLGVQPLMGDQALEGRLKNLHSPRILHLATHGFFLVDKGQSEGVEKSAVEGMIAEDWERLKRLSRLDNPMLRSGVALAGANTWFRNQELPPQAEDGLLTAVDVSGLDLSDTELVVLSACETGLGDVQVGEGVFGLRRAFMLAGAKTLVMSLWKVRDWETQQLMVEFYRRILEGQSCSAALRQAQLDLKDSCPDPLYWGAFICQGDPRPIA
jgi:CHAT domain-containing protein/tetratricopeptide (TPR) repeat protein